MVSYLLKNTVSENGTVSRGVCVVNPDGTLHSVTERTGIETYEAVSYTHLDVYKRQVPGPAGTRPHGRLCR